MAQPVELPVVQPTVRQLARSVAQSEPVIEESPPEGLEISLVKHRKTITRRRVVKKKITSVSTIPVSEPNIDGNDSLSQTDLSQQIVRSKSSNSKQTLLSDRKAHLATDINIDASPPENETIIEQV